ncbi:matrix metalloproteinase-2-like isoform X1 [Cloeon dipterum]|uniref:matrix metalloproteinase-2-like isoform X1 n=1 Tax=Cloeon dipterum TaxID=197152 RepID=UPI0032208E1A
MGCTTETLPPKRADFRLHFQLLFVLLFSTCAARPSPSYIDENVHKKLMQYGYLKQSNLETGELRKESDVINGLMEMQAFAGLQPTGKLDKATLKLLDTPRCGLPDKGDRGYRSKRYVKQGSKWKHMNITWKFIKDPRRSDLRNNISQVRQEIMLAFKVWADNSKLTFQETHPSSTADIEVGFYERRHNDNYAFDGEGQVLAHAFFPGSGMGGDVHFDDEEKWHLSTSQNKTPHDEYQYERTGTSLFFVAAHEIGHSLGLSHSSHNGALMYPYYKAGENDPMKFKLPNDDRIGIQEIYGVVDKWGQMPTFTIPTPPPTKKPIVPTKPPSSGHHPSVTEKPEEPKPKPEVPDTCDMSYDAITYFRNSEVWIFKGKYFWRIDKKNGLLHGYPLPIKSSLASFCGTANIEHVDAVYTRKDDALVFFHGKQYTACSGPSKPAERGTLHSLGLPETLEKLDAAFVWGHNGKIYLFSGNSYWRIDDDTNKVELDYPRDMSMWSGVGYNIDAAFKWKDGKIYFFKGKSYWKFDDMKMKVAHEKPMLSAPFWMGCPKRLEEPLIAATEQVASAGRSDSSKNKLFVLFATVVLCLAAKFAFLS